MDLHRAEHTLSALRDSVVGAVAGGRGDVTSLLRDVGAFQDLVATIAQGKRTSPISWSILNAADRLLTSLIAHCSHDPVSGASKHTNKRPSRDRDRLGVDEEAKRTKAISATIVEVDRTHCGFSSIVGIKDALQCLQEAVVLPVQFPHLFTGSRCEEALDKHSLVWPTRNRKAVAAEVNGPFYCVSSSDLISSWLGESEKLIRELFRHAQAQSAASVIFIDEVDSLCRKRSSAEEDSARRIKTELLRQMEGADKEGGNARTFLLCATNCPWELDSAFLRRFQKRVYVGLPDLDARRTLMQRLLTGVEHTITDEELQDLAEQTSGYSGSDVVTVMSDATMEPVRELLAAQFWHCEQADDGKCTWRPCDEEEPGALRGNVQDIPAEDAVARSVRSGDVAKAIARNPRTVSSEELARFLAYNQH
ncbi:hypothetical protein PTSG_04231 [Salpingoeca rosetta]|uniref:Uncharacterized protein n=1 Tax=Salpingoeca rosetta (strain ATCC 50818 / BSB-021) TaxID=946362 RepID=F2U6Z1_SALR5|nr:uncharacterized protein PTSG_04231 [Salpingoeca rosetta]EGD83623.1 hypothetical protein PTSG_04231 [Salpingoeca rosetta]|eukprot:XP_004995127.1 hypothetical protein PTSG_04231 [Salpingoeca rosetta]